jgi:hypothetical protein
MIGSIDWEWLGRQMRDKDQFTGDIPKPQLFNSTELINQWAAEFRLQFEYEQYDIFRRQTPYERANAEEPFYRKLKGKRKWQLS